MHVRFFDTSVRHFVETLDDPTEGKLVRALDRLEKYGHELRMPYSKMVARGLFELRTQGIGHVRLFYTFHNKDAIILHGFIKRSQKTPKKELEMALRKKKILDMI